jgi:hypothetical protein
MFRMFNVRVCVFVCAQAGCMWAALLGLPVKVRQAEIRPENPCACVRARVHIPHCSPDRTYVVTCVISCWVGLLSFCWL